MGLTEELVTRAEEEGEGEEDRDRGILTEGERRLRPKIVRVLRRVAR